MNDFSNIKTKGVSSIIRISRYTLATAAIISLILAGRWLYIFYKLSPDKLYSEIFIDYKLAPRQDSLPRLESNIAKAYRENNYNEVIRLNASSVLFNNDIFLTGIAYLKTGDPAKAISSFRLILAAMGKGNSSSLKNETEYYMALAYLKNRDFDQSIELMNKIYNDPAHKYHYKFSEKFIDRVKMLKWR